MLRVHHCDQLMRCETTELRTGGKRYDLTCLICGAREREIYTSAGKPVAWINVTLQERIARQNVELAESKLTA